MPNEETIRNQIDLHDVAELYKRGIVVKHEGLFQLSYGGVYNIPVGKNFVLTNAPAQVTREKVKAEIEELKPLFVTGNSMCNARDWTRAACGIVSSLGIR